MSLAADKAGDRHILTGVAWYVFLLQEPLNHQASCEATINKRLRHVELCNIRPYVALIQLKGESAGRRRAGGRGQSAATLLFLQCPDLSGQRIAADDGNVESAAQPANGFPETQ